MGLSFPQGKGDPVRCTNPVRPYSAILPWASWPFASSLPTSRRHKPGRPIVTPTKASAPPIQLNRVRDKQDVPTAAGTFQMRSYLVETELRDVLYRPSFDYGSAASGGDPQERLQGAKEWRTREHKLASHPREEDYAGRIPRIDFESESASAHFYARIYIGGRHALPDPGGIPARQTERRYLALPRLIPADRARW